MRRDNPAVSSKLLDIAPEVQEALAQNKPVVALESTILSHGMPYPQNVAFAKRIENVVRTEGAVPATMAIMDGRMKVGLTQDNIEQLCENKDGCVQKASRRDLPILLATGGIGATTVATTMILAEASGIKFFATGGIGGAHRGAQQTFDISADLQELQHTSVAVVCAGAKMILDIGLTLEYLETCGVPVIGYKTEQFPSFYCEQSGFGVDYCAQNPQEIARIAQAKWEAGLAGGVVIGNPVPAQFALDFDEMSAVIDEALARASEEHVSGKDTTPFLLSEVLRLTHGTSLDTNIELALNNAQLAAQIAVAYSNDQKA